MFNRDSKECICDCHCRTLVSEMTIRIPYEQELNKLKHELYCKEQVIKDLAETNKHLSRGVNKRNNNDREA